MPGKKPFDGVNSGLGTSEQTAFSLNHGHSGMHGDGKRIQAANLLTNNPFLPGLEPTYTPVNNPTSGRKYRIQIVEVLSEDGVTFLPNIQIVPA